MELLGRILVFTGRPFYFLFSRIIIAILFIFYFVGHNVLRIFNLIYQGFKKFIQKIRKIKLKIPKPKKFLILERIAKNQLFRIQPKFIKLNFKIPVRKRVIIILFLFLISTATCYLLFFYNLPSPQDLITRQQEVSTKIYDRNGNLLYTIYKDKNRTLVSLDQVPQHVRLATLAAEDAEFYSHPGFSLRGILRALSKNIRKGKLQGGSTITQQLVKNALLSPERTYIRKIREIILSIGVELNFSKDQILEMYLNEVSYGSTAYGIQEASKMYFSKDVWELNLAEAALLAGLPKSPTRFSPFGQNPELSLSRQREILHLMNINKYITDEEEENALKQPVTFSANKTRMLAPHFVMYIKDQLVNLYGEEMVEKGGLSVTTTLDLNIQNIAETIVRQEIDKLRKLNVNNASVIISDTSTGDILAMVGSYDYFDIKKDGNVNVSLRPRQPGSSIKVINYAYALANGYTLSSVIDDSPITYNIPGTLPYTPKNYDGIYRGKISIRSALAESRNIPAVKILASYGVDKMIDLGKRMGITTWEEEDRFGLSLTLGAGETKLIDLVSVYSVIANYGKSTKTNSIIDIKNYKDKDLYPEKNRFYSDKENVIIDPRIAFLLIDTLKDNKARSPAFGLNSTLVIPGHPEVAVKTGTSNNLRDNLTIGFNQDYLVAVWVGNNDNSPMSRVASGITGASSIWNKIMRTVLKDNKSNDWPVPENMVKSECFGRYEWYLKEKIQTCPKIIEPAASSHIN